MRVYVNQVRQLIGNGIRSPPDYILILHTTDQVNDALHQLPSSLTIA